MKVAVIVFPGTNCDNDVCKAIYSSLGIKAERIYFWQELSDNYDLIILPGGFSYGDYLRSGAIASKLEIVNKIKDLSSSTYILGICNGFQILTESGLLPGALIKNNTSKFMCKNVELMVENTKTFFTNLNIKKNIFLPIANKEGRYFCDKETLEDLKENNQIIFRYKDNINGSINNIAGIINKQGNIIGMMPHPERAIIPEHQSCDGYQLFVSILNYWAKNK
jgi:phosphoribosylformylglycinamidine synthase